MKSNAIKIIDIRGNGKVESDFANFGSQIRQGHAIFAFLHSADAINIKYVRM